MAVEFSGVIAFFMVKSSIFVLVMKQIEENFHLEINGQRVPTRVIRERRRSVRASVGKDAVILRLPILFSVQDQKERIAWLKSWLEKEVKKNPDILARYDAKRYESGDLLTVGKRHYHLDIHYADKASSSGKLKNGVIHLSLSQTATAKTISTLLSRLVAQDFQREIEQRVLELNAQYFQQKVNSVSLKYNHSNWGSCSSKNNINLSTRLLFAPDDVRDYVIIHELAHLIEANHSHRFWKLVQDVMPDYKTHERWLKQHGHLCRF